MMVYKSFNDYGVPRSHYLNLHRRLYQARTSTPLQKSEKITILQLV
jgi:hypothetical protein